MSTRLSTIAIAVVVSTTVGAHAQATGAGPSALTETYQDWQVACSGQGQARRCAFSQTQRQKNGQRVLALELTPMKDGSLTGILILPFGLELSKGVTLGLDDTAPGPALAVKTCLPSGCIVPLSVPAATAKSYRTGMRLKVNTIGSDTGNAISFTVSLSGFAAAQDRTAVLLQ